MSGNTVCYHVLVNYRCLLSNSISLDAVPLSLRDATPVIVTLAVQV